MTAKDILAQLQSLGQESTKKVLMKHGIPEPLYGVKIEELKKIQKKVKEHHSLAMELFDSGNYDARYLAGLIAEPGKMSKADLKKWAKLANAPTLCEYTVPWVASESNHGVELALEWIESKDPELASTGWSTLSSIMAVKEDAELDIPLLKKLLDRIAKTIHASRNRVKYAMNNFVIAAGTYVPTLTEAAKQTATKIGKVEVDMGDTACRIPAAMEYIQKAEAKKIIGKKRKSARC